MCIRDSNSGQLLSDEFVIRLIQDSIAHSENVEGFLFDGFPRTVAQAEKLDEILKENGAPLAGLLNIEVPETELKRRMLERAQIEGRADDTEEAIHNRFKEYHAKTVPVAKHYQTTVSYTHLPTPMGKSKDGTRYSDRPDNRRQVYAELLCRIPGHYPMDGR